MKNGKNFINMLNKRIEVNRLDAKEVTKILKILSDTYPAFGKVTTIKIEIWQETIGDLPYEMVSMALKKIISTSEDQFAPTIATIRKACLEIMQPDNGLSSSEAWEEVEKAIRHFGWAREIEALESMSLLTKRTVKACNWQEICSTEEIGIMKAQFMRMYDQFKARETQDKLIPQNLRPLLGGMVKDINLIEDKSNLEGKIILAIGEGKREIPQAFKDMMDTVFKTTEEDRTQIIEANRQIFIKQTEALMRAEKDGKN
jgi:hypothetical protein